MRLLEATESGLKRLDNAGVDRHELRDGLERFQERLTNELRAGDWRGNDAA